MMTKDSFSINISLRHRDPSYSLESISKALSLKPLAAYSVGCKQLGKVRSKWSSYYAHLQNGDYASEFEGALKRVVSFLKKNNDFWTDFIVGDGSVTLILNHTINPEWKNGDKCFELSLTPTFLSHLSARGIGLRVQGWQGPTQKRKSAPQAKGTRIG
ncbi:MAG: hypothetical protein WBS24_01525 [Terriglobales bacterium]